MYLAFLSPSPMELAVIAVIALIVLGPSRLPDAARSLGKGMKEMRDAFQSSTSGHDDDEDVQHRFERVEDDDLDGHEDDDLDAHGHDEADEQKAEDRTTSVASVSGASTEQR